MLHQLLCPMKLISQIIRLLLINSLILSDAYINYYTIAIITGGAEEIAGF
jgi:hypothetical protein